VSAAAVVATVNYDLCATILHIYIYYSVVVLVYSSSLSFSLFLTGTGTDRPQIVLASSARATATFYPSITPPSSIYLPIRVRRQNILTNNRTPVGMPPLTHRPDQIYLAHRVRRRCRTSSSSSQPPLYLDAVRTTNSLGPATQPEIDYLSPRPHFSVPCTLRARLYTKKRQSETFLLVKSCT